MAERPRRVTLPGADEMFFRPSDPVAAEPDPPPTASVPGARARPEPDTKSDTSTPKRTRGASGRTRGGRREAPEPSGRQRHDEKITVYVSAAELLALEQARLTLRAEHGLSADRGRLVREAVGVLLADFEEHGDASMLVRRLND